MVNIIKIAAQIEDLIRLTKDDLQDWEDNINPSFPEWKVRYKGKLDAYEIALKIILRN